MKKQPRKRKRAKVEWPVKKEDLKSLSGAQLKIVKKAMSNKAEKANRVHVSVAAGSNKRQDYHDAIEAAMTGANITEWTPTISE